MAKLEGEVLPTPLELKPFRAVLRMDGKLFAYGEMESEAAARRFLTRSMMSAQAALRGANARKIPKRVRLVN